MILKGRTVDISLGGVSVPIHEQLTPGQQRIEMFETTLNGEQRQVIAAGKVVYSILRGT